MAVAAEQQNSPPRGPHAPRESKSQSAPAGKSKITQLQNKSESIKAFALVGAAVALWFLGARFYSEELYVAEHGLGYWLGLVGGVIMLMAYVYSMRKHFRMLRFTGILSHWLRIHIWFGIVGPFLIIPHTTFRFESANGTLAFVAMSLVFLSGVVGRYLYSRVHFGLDGRRAHLKEINRMLGLDGDNTQSILANIPEVRDRLAMYEKMVMARDYGVFPAFRVMLLTRLGAHAVYSSARRNLRRFLLSIAQQQGWNAADVNNAERQLLRIVREYLVALRTVARFKAYDQIFMLWRMVHVPLLYLLMISGVIHVLYVHMY